MMVQCKPEAPVLGQILLIQGTVHAMVGDRKRAEFVCTGLHRVPGISGVRFCMGGEELVSYPSSSKTQEACARQRNTECAMRVVGNGNNQCPAAQGPNLVSVDIRTSLALYGHLLLEINNMETYQLYAPYVESLANVLALLIETEEQGKQIISSKSNLESLVHQRTTELAAVNQKLIDREHFISGIISTAPTMIYIFDIVEQRYVFANDRISAILGYTSNEIISMGEEVCPNLLHPDDLVKIRDHNSWIKGMLDGEVAEIEYRMRHRDGSYRTLRFWESVFKRSKAGVPTRTAGVALDLTEQRESEALRVALEEQFLASQRMDAVGRLAGGVAHDFNNLLTVINSYAEFGVEELREGDSLRVKFEQILMAGERAAQLTRQLLAFSRKQVLNPQLLNLNGIVSDMEKMLKRLIGEDVEMDVVLADDLGNVRADAGQLEQVLMNLAVNARDAMPKGGTLKIETKNVNLSEMFVNADVDRRCGVYAMLSVSDNGCGMDESTKQRIFEPFFTTKEAGRGTGLGLSTVYGIVKQSGGDIWVNSVLNKGTAFEVYLPRLDSIEIESLQNNYVESTPLVGGNETVLVVEDEAAIRELAHSILSSEGYTVLLAQTGGEAVLMCEDADVDVNLLLTDVIMPGINGRQLADRLLAVRPEMKVLFMSGYTADVIMKHGVSEEEMDFIPKPFSASKLRYMVRNVLDGG